jgi:hypothetical protein
MGACEFGDDEHLCALETVVVQLGAREAVIVKVGCRWGCLAGWLLGGAGASCWAAAGLDRGRAGPESGVP